MATQHNEEARRAPGVGVLSAEYAARLAEIHRGIDDLLEQVAQLRAIRLHQLAAARSGRPGS